MVVEPPENPTFSTKKEKYGGGNLWKMNQRAVFLVGRARAYSRRRQGWALAILLEIGSSFVVHSHQIGTKTEIVAREGGFFYGFDLVCFNDQVRTYFEENN